MVLLQYFNIVKCFCTYKWKSVCKKSVHIH